MVFNFANLRHLFHDECGKIDILFVIPLFIWLALSGGNPTNTSPAEIEKPLVIHLLHGQMFCVINQIQIGQLF